MRRRDTVVGLWTLLQRNHGELVPVANFALAPEKAAQMPSLQSRKGLEKGKKKADERVVEPVG